MRLHKTVLGFSLVVCFSLGLSGPVLHAAPEVPLIVDEGYPLEVVLTAKLKFTENEIVHARVVEPVYAFDRQVIPAGSEVVGKIVGFQKAGKWRRFASMLGGDFTPQREPLITFDSLILRDGTRLSIDTIVQAGAERFAETSERKDEPRKDLDNGMMFTVKEPGADRVKDFLLSLAPYHGQSLPVGTRLRAILLSQIDFGSAAFQPQALEAIGSPLRSGTTVSARLVTPLNSRTTRAGATIEALLTQPVFSANRQLLFPAGSKLVGEVLKVKSGRSWHRNGQLAFRFTSIEAPDFVKATAASAQAIEGRVSGIEMTPDMPALRINDDGQTQISESKKRFLSPAYALVKAGRSVDATADKVDQALVGAYRSKFIKRVSGSDPGLGIPGSIAGAMVPPVGVGLGVFGAARSVYSNFIGRGRDVVLPANTALEIRIE